MVLVLRISLESEPCRLSSSAFHFIQQVEVGCSKGSRMWNTVANSVKIWVKYREEIQGWPGAKCVSPILAGSSSVKQTGDVTGSHLSLPREPLARIYCVGGEIQEYGKIRWKEEIVLREFRWQVMSCWHTLPSRRPMPKPDFLMLYSELLVGTRLGNTNLNCT